ncbi:MAG: putative membrane protein (Fun14 family) [Planctomycetota bacterium]|jgi:uncharacterized membrane protein (Fun14 family)
MTNEELAIDSTEAADGGIASIALWKKAIAVLSLVLGCTGLAMGGADSGDAAARSAGGGNSTMSQKTLISPNSFGPGTSIGEGAPTSATEDSAAKTLWAPLLAKGGLSFFVAFCIGYALRTFLKGTMLVIGVVALGVFGLQKAGLVDSINWEKAQGYWDSLTANIGEQFDSLKTFVAGSLPSAASGSVGLLAGFRR